MKTLRTRKLKNCVSFSVEVEDWELNVILVAGINRFLNKCDIKGVSAYAIDESCPISIGKKTWELTDNEEQYLINVGFASILCDQLGIDFPDMETFDKFPMPRKRKIKN